MAEGTGRGESLSIWFFVGMITLLYGLVLTPYGAWQWLTHHPPANELLLPWLIHLHPTFWWGLLLLTFGAFYTTKYRPGTN
ncbi:hypothetical protein SAMN05421819_2790 [Bryocella elongata]|uniref:Uncharacterized protein n=1 Tax=Bryocella elongata TaxID=863522 RepID=A0A1H5ZPU6_9BACT|nr:hypothetical protein [Bryocella elongata]SEG38034.1 hypothetical protein SAMN05421819_2790 [Bryocella elongata]